MVVSGLILAYSAADVVLATRLLLGLLVVFGGGIVGIVGLMVRRRSPIARRTGWFVVAWCYSAGMFFFLEQQRTTSVQPPALGALVAGGVLVLVAGAFIAVVVAIRSIVEVALRRGD
jgi:hypothetical protein